MVLCSCPHRQYSGVDLTRRCNNIFLHASAGASGTLCSSPPASPGWADCAPGPAPASACLRPESWGPASPTQPQCSPCSAQNECHVEVQSREGLPPCAPAGDRVTGGPGTPMMNKTEAPGVPPVMHHRCPGTHRSQRTLLQMLSRPQTAPVIGSHRLSGGTCSC